MKTQYKKVVICNKEAAKGQSRDLVGQVVVIANAFLSKWRCELTRGTDARQTIGVRRTWPMTQNFCRICKICFVSFSNGALNKRVLS